MYFLRCKLWLDRVDSGIMTLTDLTEGAGSTTNGMELGDTPRPPMNGPGAERRPNTRCFGPQRPTTVYISFNGQFTPFDDEETS
jgi:hypothetical protein